MSKNLAVIVLAAGKGTRMKSDIPKVLHPICGRPMLGYLLDLIKSLKPDKSVMVLGHKQEEVRKIIPASVKIVIQKQLKGTGDAVKEALSALKGFKGTVLILYGDVILLKKETIAKLLRYHRENNLSATILTATVDKPSGYGRILRDKYSTISGIIEEKDADEFQKSLKEINTGIICFDKQELERILKLIKPNNQKKEYYLTDTINILYKKGAIVESVNLEDIQEALGINSRLDLARANTIMQKRINEEMMKQGVTIVDPATTFISYGVKIGKESVIYPFTVIEKDVKIGKYCNIGPFAHLREGCLLGDNTLVGNFLEIARSKIGSKTLIKHFGYIGDSNIGSRVNIGAGVVTANFDGRGKNTTVIKDHAFIGSDTVLIAPVKVGKGAKTGAGSVLVKNKNVPDGKIVAGVPAKILNQRG